MNIPFAPSRRPARPRRGFTLIELLTVIAIIGILAAIIIPTVGLVRKRAKASQCLSNLRQLAMGCQMFAQDNKDWYPQWEEKPPATRTNPNPPAVAWFLAIAGYTGQRVNNISSADSRSDGIVFQCPGAELPVTNKAASTYAVHCWLFLKRLDSLPNSTPPKMSRIPRPSQVVVFADGPQAEAEGASNSTMWYVSGTGPWDEARPPEEASPIGSDLDAEAGRGWIRYRHGTSANVAFLDGHVAAMAKGSLKNGNFLLTK